MTLSFLLGVVLENLFLPAIFIFSWGVNAVNTYKNKCKFATRDLQEVEKNTRPPSWIENRHSENFIPPNKEWLEDVRRNAQEYHDASIRDFYSDFNHYMQLGQGIQILISVVNASFYYIYLTQYISLVLLLQAVVSSISGIVFLEIRHRNYPREIEILRP